jgi:hypothetical protein
LITFARNSQRSTPENNEVVKVSAKIESSGETNLAHVAAKRRKNAAHGASRGMLEDGS